MLLTKEARRFISDLQTTSLPALNREGSQGLTHGLSDYNSHLRRAIVWRASALCALSASITEFSFSVPALCSSL